MRFRADGGTGAFTILYGLRVTSQQTPATPLHTVPTLWFTLAFNLFALLLAVVLVGLGDDVQWPLWLPVASLALSGVVGVASLARRQTRRFGAGCLGGTAVSALVYLVLFVVFLVTYFIVPGDHELS